MYLASLPQKCNRLVKTWYHMFGSRVKRKHWAFLHCLYTSKVNKISSKVVLKESDVLITQGSLHDKNKETWLLPQKNEGMTSHVSTKHEFLIKYGRH